MTNEIRNPATPLGVRFLCILLVGLTACGSSRSQYVWHDLGTQPVAGKSKASNILQNWGAKSEKPDAADPEIAPGFLLNIMCPADNKITGDYRVDFNGDMQLPYNVTLNTNGTKVSQLKEKLVDRFRSYFKSPSDMDVRVKERHYWVDVRGLVEKPGRFLVEPEASLDMVIGLAGGTSKVSAPLYVRIQKGQQMFVLDLNQYYSQVEDRPQILGWLGGEVLFFQKEGAASLGGAAASSYRSPIYVTGEVLKPGDYPLLADSDFVDALTQAGGFTEVADLENIEIIRRTGGRKRVYDFSWKNFQRAPAIQQGDVIIVHADKTTKSDRKTLLWATVLSALASVVTAAVLVVAYDNNGSL